MIRETIYGPDSPQLISTVEGLADALADGGEFVAAEPVYERLLALWKKSTSKDHPMVAVVLDKLGVFYGKEGEIEKACKALARSATIRARFLAVGLTHQAADEIAQGHREQARSLYSQALSVLTPADGDLRVQIKQILANLENSRAK